MGVHSPPAAGAEYRPWVFTNAIIMSWPGAGVDGDVAAVRRQAGEVEGRLHPLRRRRGGRRRADGVGPARPRSSPPGRMSGGWWTSSAATCRAAQLEARLRARPPACGEHDAGTVTNAARRNRFVTVRTVPGLPTGAEDTRPGAAHGAGRANRHEVAASSSVIVPDSTSCFDESWLPSATAPWSR